MTETQGAIVAYSVLVLAILNSLVMIALIFAALKITGIVKQTAGTVENKVTSVTDRAHGLLDQVQQIVMSVTGKVAVAERAVTGVVGAVQQAAAVRTAKRVAKNSATMASSVIAGVRAGVDRLLHNGSNGRDY